MGFQASVNSYLAPGKKGGWASDNPSVSLLPPSTGDLSGATNASWRVGALGVNIGQFAFADMATGDVALNHPGTGPTQTPTAVGTVRVAFVQADQPAIITGYLIGTTTTLFEGQGVALITKGDVWAAFAAGAAVGSFVFASFADGSAVAGSTTTAPTVSRTVTTTSGSAALTSVSGTLYPGEPLSGTGIPADAYVVSYDAATGAAVMSANATASGTITATVSTGVLTDFRADSAAGNGELAKISVWG